MSLILLVGFPLTAALSGSPSLGAASGGEPGNGGRAEEESSGEL